MERILVNGTVLAANYALIALGITLIFSIMNVLNFAHGQLFMIGDLLVYTLCAVFGLPYALSLVLAALAVGAIGLLVESFFFRRVMRMPSREENIMLLAVSTALLLENAALSLFGEKQHGIPPIVFGIYRIGNAFLSANRLLVLAVPLALVAAVLVFVTYSRPGRAMRALVQDRTATMLMGVDIARIGTLGLRLRGIYFAMVTLSLTEAVRLAFLNATNLTQGGGVLNIPQPSGLESPISFYLFAATLLPPASPPSGASLGAGSAGCSARCARTRSSPCRSASTSRATASSPSSAAPWAASPAPASPACSRTSTQRATPSRTRSTSCSTASSAA